MIKRHHIISHYTRGERAKSSAQCDNGSVHLR
jgi:hypothetical protein